MSCRQAHPGRYTEGTIQLRLFTGERRVTVSRELFQQATPFRMEMHIGDLQRDLDRDFIPTTGPLTKKDVFRWNLDFEALQKPNVMRSHYFKFGPTPGCKYYLVVNIWDSISTCFTVGLCRFALPGITQKDIPIRVSFSLLDTRDRCHYPCEKLLTTDVDAVYTSFDRNNYTARNSMFLFNNQLRIQCSLDAGEVMDELLNEKKSKPDIHMYDESTQDLTLDLRSLLESGKHSDVTLRLKGHEFKAHRSILVARSSVFAAMFEHDTLEKQHNHIDIVDMSSDTMDHLLRYLYTGKNEELSTQEFLSLFVAADKYNLPKLKRQCSISISPKITSDTALSVLTLAYLHQDEQLKEAAIDAVLDNALKVMKSEDWLTFLREYSELANSVILKLALKSQFA